MDISYTSYPFIQIGWVSHIWHIHFKTHTDPHMNLFLVISRLQKKLNFHCFKLSGKLWLQGVNQVVRIDGYLEYKIPISWFTFIPKWSFVFVISWLLQNPIFVCCKLETCGFHWGSHRCVNGYLVYKIPISTINLILKWIFFGLFLGFKKIQFPLAPSILRNCGFKGGDQAIFVNGYLVYNIPNTWLMLIPNNLDFGYFFALGNSNFHFLQAS